jgi:ribosomal protein S18 acetylase RimI-like enzyme
LQPSEKSQIRIFRPMIKIRKSVKADGQAVYDLLWSARAEIPLKDSFDNPDNRAWIKKHCSEGHMWVAIDGAAVVGFLFRDLEELFYLVVETKHRGDGIARSLLRKGKRKGVYCKIKPYNTAAISLVQSEGFVESDQLTPNDWVRYDYKPE